MKTMVVLMCKRYSERLKFKNSRKINGKKLVEHQFEFMQSMDFIDHKIVYTKDVFYKKLSQEYQLDVLDRNIQSTVSDNFYDIWSSVGQESSKMGVDLVIWLNSCCLFLTQETIVRAIESFGENIVLPVTKEENLLWDENGKSLSVRNSTSTQSSNFVFKLSHAFWIRTPQQILDTRKAGEYQKQHSSATLFPISKIEALDIDNEEDFLVSESVYNYLYA